MTLPSQRRREILEEILNSGAGSVSRLSDKFRVSETTIRRDLGMLEKGGHIERTHGGAVTLTREVKSPGVIVREKRKNIRALQKAQMGRYIAREFFQDGDNTALGGGTTIHALIPFLADRSDLTIVTNGLATTSELHATLHQRSDMTILCCGGILRQVSSTFVGPVAENFFRSLHVGKLFLSATGLTLETGVTDPSILETQVKRNMIAGADQVIMVMDSSKFGVKSLLTVLAIEEIDILVTDSGISEGFKQALIARGVEVHVAPE